MFEPAKKFLGAKYVPLIIAPSIANGSLTLGAINFPNPYGQWRGSGNRGYLGAATQSGLEFQACRHQRG